VTDTAAVLEHAADVLDFDQPVAVLLMGVLGHLPHLDTARIIVAGLLDPLPAGSYLALYDDTLPLDPVARTRMQQAQHAYAQSGAVPYWSRTTGDVASLFTGLELVDPGLVRIPLWRPGTLHRDSRVGPLQAFPVGQDDVAAYGGAARKS
jgi:hypothetical protein